MAISRVGKDLYKMLIKVSNTNNRKSIVVSFNLYHIYITLTTYSSPTPRSSGTSIHISWMQRSSPGYLTEKIMMTGLNCSSITYIISTIFHFRYFDDPWQNLPKDGYTAMFENMLLKDPKITVRLGMDYFK